MKSLFGPNSELRKIFAEIAEAAMEEAMTKAMEEAMARMRSTMKAKVFEQMDLLLNPLAKDTAAYSLSQPTRMKRKQIAAYNNFGLEIGAPAVADDDDGEEEEKPES
jgi:hypothetical protein